jgi:hypothetical protein
MESIRREYTCGSIDSGCSVNNDFSRAVRIEQSLQFLWMESDIEWNSSIAWFMRAMSMRQRMYYCKRGDAA